jgi:hypothetical protein
MLPTSPQASWHCPRQLTWRRVCCWQTQANKPACHSIPELHLTYVAACLGPLLAASSLRRPRRQRARRSPRSAPPPVAPPAAPPPPRDAPEINNTQHSNTHNVLAFEMQVIAAPTRSHGGPAHLKYHLSWLNAVMRCFSSKKHTPMSDPLDYVLNG